MIRLFAGLLVSLAGGAVTILTYAAGEHWRFDLAIFWVALAASLVAFVAVRALARGRVLSPARGLLVGYLPVLTVMGFLGWRSMEGTESRMWLPVVILVAAVYGFPIAFSASWGGRFAAGRRKG